MIIDLRKGVPGYDLHNSNMSPIILLILLTATGCSSVKSGFLKEGYIKNRVKMIKNVVIVTKPVPKNPGMAELVSNIASDIIKSQKNYIVHGFRKMGSKWPDECKNIEGVIVFSLKDIKTFNESVFLDITGKLFGCRSGNLLWSSNGADEQTYKNSKLKHLTESYSVKYKETADKFAAPLFRILQDMIDTMPNPELTDDEIMKKIEIDSQS